MAIWMDMTNSLEIWKGGVVGIIRAELEMAKNLKKKNDNIRFCICKDYGIYEVCDAQLEWLWKSDSVSDAYAVNHKHQSTENNIEEPLGLIQARNFSEGRLERINRAGHLWINSLPKCFHPLGRILFYIPFSMLSICSFIRMKWLKSQDNKKILEKKFCYPFSEGDIIFSCGWNNSNKEFYFSKVKSELKNISLVYLIYDLVLAKPEFKPLFQETAEFEWYIDWIANNCDYIFYGGETAKIDAETYFRKNKLPILPSRIVRFGSEILHISNNNISIETVLKKYSIDPNYILAIGSIAPKKNYSTIYKAFTIMATKCESEYIPNLVIVGGKFGNVFLTECIEKDPRVNKHITLISPNDEELDILYRNCKLVILPTLYEGWSLTLPEALSYHKFCLASKVAPLIEIAGDLIDYVEPMNAVEWAEKIIYYTTNPSVISDYEKRIRSDWHKITWENCGDTVNKYLNDIYQIRDHVDKEIYYDMTLAYQLALSGANVSGILRTQLLLAKFLSHTIPSMKFCAFTEFGYINLDKYTISALLRNDNVENAFQCMRIQIQKAYTEKLIETRHRQKKSHMPQIRQEKLLIYKEIFWLICSSMPSGFQKLILKQWKFIRKHIYKCPEGNFSNISLLYKLPFKNNDILFSTGVGLGKSAYEALDRHKREENFKFIQLIYDFTPVLFPHLHQNETCKNYIPFLQYTYKIADLIFYGGQTAQRDGTHYQKENKLALKKNAIIKFGSDIVKQKDYSYEYEKQVLEKYGIKKDFLISVGSIEARKNQETLYYAYIDMLSKKEDLPQLLFCGYPGWKTEEFRAILQRDDRIKDKVMIITPSDIELDVLYKKSKFTLLASIYEGWSLTLPESLNYGKFCLASDVAPLREIGRDFVEYIETYDIKKWSERILYYCENSEKLIEKETYIRKAWHAITWEQCAIDITQKLIKEL